MRRNLYEAVSHEKTQYENVTWNHEGETTCGGMTGIPTTRARRKRKALNTLTGGAYGKYQRTRAKITRPFVMQNVRPLVWDVWWPS